MVPRRSAAACHLPQSCLCTSLSWHQCRGPNLRAPSAGHGPWTVRGCKETRGVSSRHTLSTPSCDFAQFKDETKLPVESKESTLAPCQVASGRIRKARTSESAWKRWPASSAAKTGSSSHVEKPHTAHQQHKEIMSQAQESNRRCLGKLPLATPLISLSASSCEVTTTPTLGCCCRFFLVAKVAVPVLEFLQSFLLFFRECLESSQCVHVQKG